MKSINRILISLAVAAMAMAGAQAATVGAQTYAVGNEVYTLNNVLSIDNVALPGYINVVYTAGPGALLLDPSGSIFVKMKLNNPQLVQAQGGQWVNPNIAIKITCDNTWTRLYRLGEGTLSVADQNCVMFNQIKAGAN